jgi:hypothetical protein
LAAVPLGWCAHLFLGIFGVPLKHPDAEYLMVAVLAKRIHLHITLNNKYSAITPKSLARLFVRRVLCTWK